MTSFTQTGSDVTHDDEQIFPLPINEVSQLVSEEAGRHFTSMDTLKIRGVQLQATSGNKVTELRLMGGSRGRGRRTHQSADLLLHADCVFILTLKDFLVLLPESGGHRCLLIYDTTNCSID